MKSVIVMMFAMPVIAFGGTCFKATTVVPTPMPEIICISKIQDSQTEGVLDVITYDNEMPSTLKITKLSRHNEDRVNFEAEALLTDAWDAGCGAGVLATLKVSGQLVLGSVGPEGLKISADVQTANDTCHSPSYYQTVEYAFVK